MWGTVPFCFSLTYMHAHDAHTHLSGQGCFLLMILYELVGLTRDSTYSRAGDHQNPLALWATSKFPLISTPVLVQRRSYKIVQFCDTSAKLGRYVDWYIRNKSGYWAIKNSHFFKMATFGWPYLPIPPSCAYSFCPSRLKCCSSIRVWRCGCFYTNYRKGGVAVGVS